MILHVNHLQPGVAAAAGQTVASLLTLVEEARLDARLLASLRLHLDWIQYRANFRDPVSLRRATDADGQPLTLAEIAVDLRRPADAPAGLRRALRSLGPEGDDGDDRAWLEAFGPLRGSIIWRFNDLFWKRLTDWEAASGRGFEQALPSGRSDANHPEAVADSVADFWTLLRELDKRGGLPAEIFVLEIGVGTGTRAALWLDRFQALDEERGTGYYPRLRFLLGDYSLPTLDRALSAVERHRELVSILAMDAHNPLKVLSFLRYKILSIHLTNVYDNLAVDELVRRDGRLYLVEARAYLDAATAARIAGEFAITPAALPSTIERLLELGPEVLGDRARGAAFWRAGVGWSSPGRALASSGRAGRGAAAARRAGGAPRGHAGGRARRRALPHLARRRRELRQHAAAAAPARLPPRAGHLRDLDGGVPSRFPRTRQARRLGDQLGERRHAGRGGGPRRLRRALRAVPLPAQLADLRPLHHPARLMTRGKIRCRCS